MCLTTIRDKRHHKFERECAGGGRTWEGLMGEKERGK